MAVANVKRPAVVRYGGAKEQRFTYTNGASLALAMGDLVRITTSGTVEVALASAAGAVHGMALEAAVAGAEVSVLLFTTDTVVALSAIDAVVPTTSLKKGVAYTLELGTSPNEFGVTATATSGIALVEDYESTGQPWNDTTSTYSPDSSTAGGTVLVRFSAATLDGSAAAA